MLAAALFGCAAWGPAVPAAHDDALVRERIVEGTIGDLQRRLRSGEISCEAIVRGYLERIRAYDQPTGLNAITATAPDALAQARAIDDRLQRGAESRPLFCIPIVVKDNIDTAGLPTSGGSIVLRDSVPPDDAAIVRALRSAGAIVIAKTNMAEWAFSPRRTISSTAGETANAYALDRVPAGSSGGTASAVAASFALAGLGTDTGNSIRGPSSHLALVGMRPTYGRVSLDGVIPLLLDHDAAGPMTRTVEDNARLLTILATTATLAGAPVGVDYVASLDRVALRGARVGVLRALADPASMDSGIAKLFAASLDDLRRAGAIVVDDVAVEGFGEHVANGYYCPRFRADVNAYLQTLGPHAPVHDIAEVFRAGRFAPQSREQFEFFMHEAPDGPAGAPCAAFDANVGRQAFRRSVVAAMDRARVAALLYPTWTFPPALRARAVEDYRGDNSQLVAPSTGLPALTVPMGFNSDGLPAGLQLLGRPWSEATLYGIAWQYERATHHRVAPKLFPPVAGAAAADAAQSPLIARSLLFGNPERTNAKLSPDGKRLAFLAPVNGVLNVWVGPVDDVAAARPVTGDTLRGIRQYFWTHRGDHLLYLQDTGGDENFQLYQVGLQDGAARNLTNDPKVQTRILALSPLHPDEVLAGFNERDARFHDAFRIDLRSGTRKLVFDSNGYTDVVADADLQVRYAVRSNPDGGSALYAVRDGKVDDARPFLSFDVDDAFGTRPLSFEHEGKAFYLLDSRGRDKAALVRVDARNGRTTVLAEDGRADISGALIDPRTGHVSAYQVDYLDRDLVAVDAAARADVELLTAKLPGSVEVVSQSDDDSTWIVLADPGGEPGTYYLWERAPRRLTRLFSSRPKLAGQQLARMHPVELRSRDGLTLVSYLTLPHGREPGSVGPPVPLVLLVHGGPWARDTLRFYPEHQWLANRGYAVLSVNFRGSTGFGKRFVNAGNGQWAGKMHDDLIDGVEWAIRQGIASRERVAIFGTSYGGYSALVGLTFTPNVFACAVDIVGPTNLVTLFKSVPPYWQAFFQQLVNRVGDPRTEAGRELLRSRSPLTFVDRISRPLLIGQGANDPRVPQSEADQIVAAMRARNIPATYVLYPDEGHGFVRPANRISFNAVAEPFLARCLGGRVEPIGADLAGSSLRVLEGADRIDGLAAAMKTDRDDAGSER